MSVPIAHLTLVPPSSRNVLFLSPLQSIIANDRAWKRAPQGCRHPAEICSPLARLNGKSLPFSPWKPAETTRKAMMTLCSGLGNQGHMFEAPRSLSSLPVPVAQVPLAP